MKTFAIIAATAAFASATPLMAAGFEETVVQPAPVTPVAPAPVPMSAGNWTGFYAGAQLGYGDLDTDLIPDDEDFSGGNAGLHAGFLYDFGRIVVGAEIDYETSNIEADTTGVEVDSLSRAKLRLGYDAGNFLPYITAGGVQAETSGALEVDEDGSFAGIGVDYRVTDRIRVGGEILQHQFDDFAETGEDLDATTVSARVSFQF